MKYTGEKPAGEVPSWMEKEYVVWYRCPRNVLHNQIGSPDFASEMNYAPKCVFNNSNKREYSDFMSGNWAWKQADTLALDPENAGATFCPIILGSNKTTVSVATGSNEYYPLYISNGLVTNGACRAHRGAVSVLAFLAIPKSE